MPGFGFSDKPSRPGGGCSDVADAWAELMGRLGYERYGAQGGDWGAGVTPPSGATSRSATWWASTSTWSWSTRIRPPWTTSPSLSRRRWPRWRLMPTRTPDISKSSPPTADRRLWAGRFPGGPMRVDRREVLVMDRLRRRPLNVFTRDELLDNVMLHWIPATGARRRGSTGRATPLERVTRSPCRRVARFSQGDHPPSCRWAEKAFPDIRWWDEPDKGGHFAAIELPGLFVEQVRSFFRLLR